MYAFAGKVFRGWQLVASIWMLVAFKYLKIRKNIICNHLNGYFCKTILCTIMDYSNKFFGKKIDDLNYVDIQTFFTVDQDETDTIEFKSFNSAHGNIETSLDGIKKGITAMLNSNGGIILWGAPEGRAIPGKTEKVFGGALSPVNQLIEKDRLINKISSAIIPLPVGVNVKILNVGNDYVYIFEIQKSQYSPHQINNIYYVRLDGQSKPAPHYFIDALFKKISYPNIQGYIKLAQISTNGNLYFLDIEIYIFNVSELQNEEDVSFSLMSDAGFFAKSQDPNPNVKNMYSYSGHRLIHQNLIKVLSYGQPNQHFERIVINPHEAISKWGNKLNLMLDFGGKKSPRKSSNYIIDLVKIDWNKPNEPTYLFESMEENILLSDARKNKGLTTEQQISSVLGR